MIWIKYVILTYFNVTNKDLGMCTYNNEEIIIYAYLYINLKANGSISIDKTNHQISKSKEKTMLLSIINETVSIDHCMADIWRAPFWNLNSSALLD